MMAAKAGDEAEVPPAPPKLKEPLVRTRVDGQREWYPLDKQIEAQALRSVAREQRNIGM